jgi:hypothetical protein
LLLRRIPSINSSSPRSRKEDRHKVHFNHREYGCSLLDLSTTRAYPLIEFHGRSSAPVLSSQSEISLGHAVRITRVYIPLYWLLFIVTRRRSAFEASSSSTYFYSNSWCTPCIIL